MRVHTKLPWESASVRMFTFFQVMIWINFLIFCLLTMY